MKTIDRYIIRLFLTNYLVLFVVLIMLIIVLDLIINIDEFAQLAERMPEATWWVKTMAVSWAAVDFYGPQVFMFYTYAAGILPIGAAGFALAQMIRNRELVAMLAGGVSLYRVAAPILVIGTLASGLLLVNQELAVPAFREKLMRSHKHIKEGGIRPFSLEFVPDPADDDGAADLYTAARFDPKTGTLHELTVLQRDGRGRATAKITADRATWQAPANRWRLQEGWVVDRSQTDDVLASQPIADQRRRIDLLPSGLDPTTIMLHRNSRFTQYLSIRELDALSDRGSIVNPDELARIKHGRFSLVVINVLILAMGLPYFLVRGPANLLIASVKAAPLCLGAWAGGFVVMQIGSGGLDVPPALAAWLPTLIYLPLALFQLDRIRT